MSPHKDPFIARLGQAEVVQYQRNNPKLKILPVKFPGGYGKTETIGLSYNDKRSARQADRLLVVVANDLQSKQIENEFAATCRHMGFEILGGVFPCDADHPFLRVSKLGKAEAYVTTIQRVSSTNRRKDFDMLRLLMSDGHRWMLAADEYHHYSTGNDWGVSLSRLVNLAAFTIATSATPDRDGEPTIFGRPLVQVTYKEAILEKAVKKLDLRHWNYRVVTEDIHTKATVEFTTEELRDEIGTEEVDTYLQKRHLRLHPDYINPVLQGSLHALMSDQIKLHPKCQLLVRGFSCNHARILCDQIKSYQYLLTCDWIGTGVNGRFDDENQTVIKRFCPSKDEDGKRPLPTLDVLVQVGMAGEGFDTIYVSQLTDLSLVAMKGNANQTKQFILRGARWIPNGNSDAQVCRLNVGTDHPIISVAGGDLEDWIDSNVDFSGKTGGGTDIPPGGNGPDLWPVDWQYTNLKEVELLSVSKDDPVCQGVMQEIRKGSTNPEWWTWNNEQAVEEFTRLFNQMQRNLQKQQQDLNEVIKQDQLRLALKKMTRLMTNQILERCKRPWTDFQDVIKTINRAAAKVSGSYVDEADSGQLEVSYKYLANLHNEIMNGNIPQWLN